MRVKVVDNFKAADGQPFRIMDPDPAVQKKARDEAEAKDKTTWLAPTIEAKFDEVMVWFLTNQFDKDDNGRPVHKQTPEDVGNAYTLIKGFKNAQNGYYELETPSYEWLMGTLIDREGIAAFGVTQAVVKEHLRDLYAEPALVPNANPSSDDPSDDRSLGGPGGERE